MSTMEPAVPLERIVNPGDTLHGEQPVTPKPKRKFSFGLAVAWIVTILFLLVTLFPFYWMVRTAFSNGAVLATKPASLLPVDFTLGAFKRVLGLSTVEEAQAQGGSGASVNFWLALRNSIIIAMAITSGRRCSARWPPTRSPGCAGRAAT